MSLTEQEKFIYNTFLIASRSVKNKPFKLRKDFASIDDRTYGFLKKLSAFFSRNKNINIKDFFTAPHHVYTDQFFDLGFFTTLKAVKCYTQYVKSKETSSPDCEDTINKCKEICSFIYKFCKANNLTLEGYKSYINGSTPIVLQHLKDHKINFYIIHGLNCENVLRRVESDILNFFVSDFDSLLIQTRTIFQSSEKLKHVVRKSLAIVESELLKNKSPKL